MGNHNECNTIDTNLSFILSQYVLLIGLFGLFT